LQDNEAFEEKLILHWECANSCRNYFDWFSCHWRIQYTVIARAEAVFELSPISSFNSLIEPNFLLPLVLIATVAGIVLIVKPNFEALNGT